ncbi:MAG TPA: DUF3037 domain-containing protein [Gemmatimonadaceae bacterium]|nr:DUF3037 domain-containing protein [Gemmatimonadaceae bacterium]
MSATRVDYDFAVLRVVPRVHLGAFVNVGVVVHARTVEFLALRAVTDEQVLAAHVHGLDADLLARYLRSCERICAGDVDAGPMALAPPSERFHWLTAPRSDVLQSSPVHEGIADDPRRALEALFEEYVTIGHPGGQGDGC